MNKRLKKEIVTTALRICVAAIAILYIKNKLEERIPAFFESQFKK